MSQIRPNKAVVPINSDGYNLTGDLASMADSLNVPIKVGSLSERNALAVTAGTAAVRTDLPGMPYDLYDGAAWQDATIQPITLVTANYQPVGTMDTQTVNAPSVGRIGRRVFMTGVATNKIALSFSGNTEYQLGTLPAGFAPAVSEYFPMEIGFTICRGYVRSDGQVRFKFPTSIPSTGAGLLFWSLSGMSWVA